MQLTNLYNRHGEPHDRYVVVGTSGSGKSTLAHRLAWHTSNRHIELDGLFWLPDWQMREADDFRAHVARACAGERWVVDGNYSKARDIAWQRAQAIVWLDLPFHVVMTQMLGRTLDRCISRCDLWNSGNHATFRRAFLSRDSIIWWAAKTWKQRKELYSTLLYQPQWNHLDIFRVRFKDLSDVEVRRGRPQRRAAALASS